MTHKLSVNNLFIITQNKNCKRAEVIEALILDEPTCKETKLLTCFEIEWFHTAINPKDRDYSAELVHPEWQLSRADTFVGTVCEITCAEQHSYATMKSEGCGHTKK